MPCSYIIEIDKPYGLVLYGLDFWMSFYVDTPKHM